MALRCAYAGRHVVPLLVEEGGGFGGSRRPPPQSRPPPPRWREPREDDGVSLPPPWRWMGEAHHIRVVDGATNAKTTAAVGAATEVGPGPGRRPEEESRGSGATSKEGGKEARLALGGVLDAFYDHPVTTTAATTETEEGKGRGGRPPRQGPGRDGPRDDEDGEAADADADGDDGDGGGGGARKRPRLVGILRRQDATVQDERLMYQRQDAFSPEPPPPGEDGNGGGGDSRGDKDEIAGRKGAVAATEVATMGSEGDESEQAGEAAGRRRLRRQDATLEDERVKYQRQNATIQDGGSSASENERVPMDVDDVGHGGVASKDSGAATDRASAGGRDDVAGDSGSAGRGVEFGGCGDAAPTTRAGRPRPRPVDEVDLARRLRFPRHHHPPPRRGGRPGVDDADDDDAPAPRRYDDVTVYSTLVALGLVVPRSATLVRRGRRKRKWKRGDGGGPPSRWSSHLFDPILLRDDDDDDHNDADDVAVAPWFEVGDEVEAKWHPPDPKRGVGHDEARFLSRGTGGDDRGGDADDAVDGQRSSEENQHHEPGWYPGFITRVRRSAPPTLWRVLTKGGGDEPSSNPPSLSSSSSRIYYDVEYEDGDVDVGLPESLIRKKRPHGEGSDSEDDGDGDGGLRAVAVAAAAPPSETTGGGPGGADGGGQTAGSSIRRKRNRDAADGDVEADGSTPPAPTRDDVAPRPTGTSVAAESGSESPYDEDDADADADDDDAGADFDYCGRGRMTYSLGVVNEYRSRFDAGVVVAGDGRVPVPPAWSSPTDPDPSAAATGGGSDDRGAGPDPADAPGDGTGKVGVRGPAVDRDDDGAAAASSSTRRGGVSSKQPATGANAGTAADSPPGKNSADPNRGRTSETTATAPPTPGGAMEEEATTGKKAPPAPQSVGGCAAAAKEEKAAPAPAPAPSSRDDDPPSDHDRGTSSSATELASAPAAARPETKESTGDATTVGDRGAANDTTKTDSSSAAAATEPRNDEHFIPPTAIDGSSSVSSRPNEAGADAATSRKKDDILDDSKQNEGEKKGGHSVSSGPAAKRAAAKAGSKPNNRPQYSVDTAMMLQRGPLGTEDLLAGRRGATTTSGAMPASVPSSSAGGGGLRMPPPPPQYSHAAGGAGRGAAAAPNAAMAPVSSASAWGGVGGSLPPPSSSPWTTSPAAAQAQAQAQTEPYLAQLAAAHSAAAAAEAAAAARYPTAGGATAASRQLDLLDAMEGRRARAQAAAMSVAASPPRLPPQAAAQQLAYPSHNPSSLATAGLSPQSVQFSAAAARAATAAYDDPYASAAAALYLEDLAAAQSSLAAATYEYNVLVRHAQRQQQREQQERRMREHAAAIAAASAAAANHHPGGAAMDPASLLRSPYDAWAATSQQQATGLSPHAAHQLALLQAANGGFGGGQQRQRPSSANAAVRYSSSPYGDDAGMTSALLGSMRGSMQGSMQGSTTARPRPSSASTFHQQMRQLERRYVANENSAYQQRPATAMAAVSAGDMMNISAGDMMNIREHARHQQHHRGGGGATSASVHRGLPHHHGYNHAGGGGGGGAALPPGGGAAGAGTPVPPHPADRAHAQARAQALAELGHGRPSSAGARLPSSLPPPPPPQQGRTAGRQQQPKTGARPTSGGGGAAAAARGAAGGTTIGGVAGGASTHSNDGPVPTESANVRGRRGVVDGGGAAARGADAATGALLSPPAPPTDDDDGETPTDGGGDAGGDPMIGRDGHGDGPAEPGSEPPRDTPATRGGGDVTPSSFGPCRSEAATATGPDGNPGSRGPVATSAGEGGRGASDAKVASSSPSADVDVANPTTGGGNAESIKGAEAEGAGDDEAEKNPSSVQDPSTCVPATTAGSKNVESGTSDACTTSSSGVPSSSAGDKSASAGSAPEQKSPPSDDKAAAAITKPIESVVSSEGVSIGSEGAEGARTGVDQPQLDDDGGETTATRPLRTFVAPPAPPELESDHPRVAGRIRRGIFPSDLRSALRRKRRRRHPGARGGDADVPREGRASASAAPTPPDADGEAPSSDAVAAEPTDAGGAARADDDFSPARTEEATLSRLEGMCLDYLLAVAGAVSPLFSPPRDEAWIVDEMVEWCASPRASSPAGGGRNSDVLARKGLKEVLNAIITVWLWRQLEGRASPSGDGIGRNNLARVVSVDSEECTFMMKRAVDTALRAASEAVDDDDGGDANVGDGGGGGGTSTSKNARVAGKVCNSLRRALVVDCNVDEALLHLPELVRHLENQRRTALHLMLYERALLATYLSFTLTMSDNFSNAYVASLIVAGEALGHDGVCDLVRDDVCGVCTLLPYDIVPGQNHHLSRDPSAEWEDPCRPTASYTRGLNAIELTRRAHARAQVHRSLFKLQEKHGFQGGTSNAGPYDDTPAPNDPSSAALTPTASAGGATPRGGASGLKRKSSFTGREIDATGGATHSGALQYPAHYCAPLVIQKDDISFLPYGRHTQIGSESSPSPSAKRARVSVEPASSKEDHTTSANDAMDIIRSTEPIDWLDVAKMFQPVALPDQSAAATVAAGSQVVMSAGKSTGVEGMPKIFAPVVRQLEKRTTEPLDSLSDTEEEDDDSLEEDISDDAVLSRHQAVLDHMKEKLDVAMGQRNNRARSFSGTAPARASASAR